MLLQTMGFRCRQPLHSSPTLAPSLNYINFLRKRARIGSEQSNRFWLLPHSSYELLQKLRFFQCTLPLRLLATHFYYQSLMRISLIGLLSLEMHPSSR
jgi:hypothetical protein